MAMEIRFGEELGKEEKEKLAEIVRKFLNIKAEETERYCAFENRKVVLDLEEYSNLHSDKFMEEFRRFIRRVLDFPVEAIEGQLATGIREKYYDAYLTVSAWFRTKGCCNYIGFISEGYDLAEDVDKEFINFYSHDPESLTTEELCELINKTWELTRTFSVRCKKIVKEFNGTDKIDVKATLEFFEEHLRKSVESAPLTKEELIELLGFSLL